MRYFRCKLVLPVGIAICGATQMAAGTRRVPSVVRGTRRVPTTLDYTCQGSRRARAS